MRSSRTTPNGSAVPAPQGVEMHVLLIVLAVALLVGALVCSDSTVAYWSLFGLSSVCMAIAADGNVATWIFYLMIDVLTAFIIAGYVIPWIYERLENKS